MGPIQIFIFGFADFEATGAIAEQLEQLSDAGTIRIIDARMLYKPSDDELVAVQASDLGDIEREDLRAAAGALIGLGAGAVLGGDEEAEAAGMVLGADAALGLGEIGMTDDDIAELGDDMEVGDALMVLVIENVWAAGLRDALRTAGVVFAQQDYVTPEGLIALGGLLGLEVALETEA
jgi:uncharacterized membrane protein